MILSKGSTAACQVWLLYLVMNLVAGLGFLLSLLQAVVLCQMQDCVLSNILILGSGQVYHHILKKHFFFFNTDSGWSPWLEKYGRCLNCEFNNITNNHACLMYQVFFYTLHGGGKGQWRTQEFCSGGWGFNKFNWGQREQGSGGGSPLLWGSGGSCNLVQEISFHIVKNFLIFGTLRLFMMATNLFVTANVKLLRT